MTDTPPLIKPSSPMPYVWAAVIFVLIGVVFALGILFLRPQADPLVVIGAIVAAVSTLFGLTANQIQAKTTHDTVNSASTEAIAAATAKGHAEGMLKGTADEQARITKLAVMTAALAKTDAPFASAAAPVPVEVVGPTPVPVKETPGGKA